jgi:hypothetical protein
MMTWGQFMPDVILLDLLMPSNSVAGPRAASLTGRPPGPLPARRPMHI